MACYHGYVDVVMGLSQCPYLDVNWQDNEGNTALIIAAQAGYVFISNYLLNYFPGMDIERRNCHGFTALMKAAMQGQAECVRALMLAGGDIQARDNGRSLTPRDWALFTGRYETAHLMHRLMSKPCAEQFCDSFSPEWPPLEVSQGEALQSPGSQLRTGETQTERLSQRPPDPQMELQDEEDWEEAGRRGEETSVTSDKQMMGDGGSAQQAGQTHKA